jgi:hypothetical protein
MIRAALLSQTVDVACALARGEAHVPIGFGKKGRATVDLVARKVLPPN